MNFINKLWQKLKNPHGIWLCLFYVFFALVVSSTIVLVVIVQKQSFYHYILYAFSALLLTYFVYTIVKLAPKMKKATITALKKHKFTNSLLENYGYRTVVFSVISFIINIAYVVFLGVLAFLTKSAWYISITAYYLILSLMKGNVFYSKQKSTSSDIKHIKTYRFSGIMFILLMIAFSGIIVLIYKSNMYFEYAGLMIYAVAAYTFYKLGFAIYNIFKAKRQDDWYVQNIRNINLASALISLIVLQVAMFQAFSPENNTSVANGLTGGAVALIIMALGIYMIYKANKTLKQKENKNGKK